MLNNIIKPLQLGTLNLANNLIQGPLAGYSCAPFRVITNRYGQPAYTCTEMISAKDLIHRKHKPKRYLWRDPEEQTVCYQIAANEPDIAARGCEIVAANGADIIDLNCGCPVNKIRQKGLGSKLLHDPEHLYRVVSSMLNSTDAVITVKIRVDAGYGDIDNVAIAHAIESAGAAAIIVHGRHWRERYDVDSRWQEIKSIVDAVNIPVIANGDIDSSESVKNLYEQTGCAGFMVARAGVGQPWLFQQIIAELNNETFTKPSFAQIGEMFMEHINRLIKLESEKLAILQSRKFAKYYARELPNRKPFVERAQAASSQDEINSLIKSFFI